MKKYIKISLIYAILAMAGGVFFREFTKFNAFDGVTALGKVHTHLFMLGMFFFLIVGILAKGNDLETMKSFKVFMVTYNIGVGFSAIMLLVRGILQVVNAPISNGVSAAISGVAGISHMLLGLGIILFFVSLLKSQKVNEAQN